MKPRWSRRFWLSASLVVGLAPLEAFAQVPASPQGPMPVPPSGPVPVMQGQSYGPIKRAFHRIGRAIHEDFIGDPNEFVEPPLGFFVNEHRALMVSKADVHRFTLYQS